MTSILKHPKIRAAWMIAISLGLLIGFMVSSPDFYTVALLGMILLFFSLPLLVRWHHVLLIVVWNSYTNAFFLPGSPDMWVLMAAFSVGVCTLHHLMVRKQFIRVPEMTRPLLFLTTVIVITAACRGGIGIRSLGGNAYGGRYYIYLLAAVAGYFALTSERIPLASGRKMAVLFFISGATSVIGTIALAVGPGAYFLCYFFTPPNASSQLATEYGLDSFNRFEGFGSAACGVLCVLLVLYGLRGLFDLRKPWRFLLLCLTIVAATFAGFRSIMILLFLILALQFYWEGLMRTRLFLVVSIIAVFAMILAALFLDRLPGAVQRSMSFLPLKVDSSVRDEATASTDWRVQMWSVVAKDLPKYLLLGKGYGIDPTDMFLTEEGIRMGYLPDYESALLAGDYHSGPLSILVPFGIFGLLGFVWVLGAGFWVLRSNYLNGHPRLRRINCLFLCHFSASVMMFFFIFGAFNTELVLFLGTVGMSISLNGGVKRATSAQGVIVPMPVSLTEEFG